MIKLQWMKQTAIKIKEAADLQSRFNDVHLRSWYKGALELYLPFYSTHTDTASQRYFDCRLNLLVMLATQRLLSD